MSDRNQSSAAASGEERHRTFLHIQWAFALSCAYLLLFNEQAEGTWPGALLIVGLFALNLVLGRIGPAILSKTSFMIGLALVDILLVTACLYVADQLNVEIVLLCLGVLVMSIAGLDMRSIAVLTLAMMATYLLSVWATSSESLLRSSVLLRVPLLFTSAFVFAWLVEAGSEGARSGEPAGEIDARLSGQLDAIRRCEAALSSGDSDDARAALAEVSEINRTIHTRARALIG